MAGKPTVANFYIEEDQLPYNRLQQEINYVRGMCHCNFGGYWELAFLPYEGSYYDQPAKEMEWIMKIISYINAAIKQKNDNEKKNKK